MASKTHSAWRICDRRHLPQAMSGAGAARYGGRWNSPGTPMVYLAGSRALAQLEMRVHAQALTAPTTHVMFEVKLKVDSLHILAEQDLPENWRSYPAPEALAKLGDRFASEGLKLALQVPSVVIPEEPNFLLNPRHPAAAELEVGEPKPVVYDARLFATG